MTPHTLLAALAIVTSANAFGAYKCNIDGQTTYMQTPCPQQGTVGEELERRRIQKQQAADERTECARKFDGHQPLTVSGHDGSVYEAERQLRDMMKDPASFAAIRWSEITRGCGTYHVTVTYRARNGFGGYSVETADVTLAASGHVLDVKTRRRKN